MLAYYIRPAAGFKVFTSDAPILNVVLIFLSSDFLGRTEVSLAKLVAKGKSPWHERLLLHEVKTGEVVVRIELQLT